jgi:hypothetical protein
MDARRTIGLAGKAAILMIGVVLASGGSTAASGSHRLSITRAETAARQAVREHPSYRGITSTLSGLVTRRCWRARGASVRCSLYVVVASPCALGGGDPGRLCAQVLTERRWLVSVRRAPHGPAARILKITSGPSAGVSDP